MPKTKMVDQIEKVDMTREGDHDGCTKAGSLACVISNALQDIHPSLLQEVV
jgi:hypothetical protein